MTMRMRRTPSKSKRDGARKGTITQRMLYERKREEELFTALARKGWEFQVDVAKDLYNQYCTRIDFRLGLNKYLIKGQTSNGTLIKAFAQLSKRPFINRIIVFGMEGLGKSCVARKLARQMAKAFGCAPLFRAPSGEEYPLGEGPYKLVPISYMMDQTRAIFARDDAPGSIVYQDEMPEMRGENSKRFKADMTNLLKVTARAEKINLVFVNPELIVPFKLNWAIEVLGANYEKRLTLCMLYYFTRASTIVADGVLIFSIDEPGELTTWYEDMMLKNKRDLREQSGTATAKWSTADQDVQDILAAVERAGGIGTRGELEAFVKNPANDLQHVFEHGFVKDAITVAWGKIKGAASSKDASTEVEYDGDSSDFTVDIPALLDGYPEKRDAELYMKYQDPRVKQDDLAAEYNLDQSTISRIAGARGEVTGWLAERVGILYEQFLAKRLQEQHPGAEVERDGSKGQPDIRMDDANTTVFYSVKCYDTTRKSVSIPVDEVRPEIEAARALKEEYPDRVVKCILHLYNRATGHAFEKDVRINDPPNSFLFKFKA